MFTVLTWTDKYSTGSVIRDFRRTLLVGLTALAGLMSLVGLIGFLGAFAHRKWAISVHALLIWPVLISAVVVGYACFKDVNGQRWETGLSALWDAVGEGRQDVQTKVWRDIPVNFCDSRLTFE